MADAFLARRPGATTLHYDEGCPNLQQADDYRPVDSSEPPNSDECGHCTGEAGDKSDQDWNAYRSLVAAAGGESGAE